MTEFYDRTSFWLFIVDIPHLHGKELFSAVKIKLGSLFPGNIEDCNIQIRKNGTKKGNYLIFVLNKDTGKVMLPVSPLFIQHLYSQQSASVLFVNKNWLDFIRIENGAIKSSIVKCRNEDIFPDDIRLLCAEEKTLIIYCDKNDRNLFTNLDKNMEIQINDINTELKKIDIHKTSLFNEKSSIIFRQRIILATAIFSLLLMGSWLFYQYHKNEKELNASLRLEQERRLKEEKERRREVELLDELINRYQQIVANKTATPFEIALVISECANSQTRIQSATFNRNFFQIEGLTNSSLELLQNFENHRLVENARLHQVHPFGNRDTFTLSGTVAPFSETVDKELPVSEQIVVLENLIAIETENLLSGTQLTPSAFGTAVNSLFTKWRCGIISYQFINELQKTEIELSLRGTGSGFFNALYEIKTNYRSWDIHLTQIRNLYPRNLLEVIVRIRTNYVNTKPENNSTNITENITQSSVAGISRNYFVHQPVSRPVSEVRITEQPAPVVSPSVSAERVNWLEYVGSIHIEDAGSFIYVKNTRTGSIFMLGQHSDGDMRYAINKTGGIIAYIDENIYEIARR